MRKLNNIKAVAFDLDGTIYLGNKLLDNAKEVITRLRELSVTTLFITNNSSNSRIEIVMKLNSLDLDVSESEVYNSSYSTARYCKEFSIKDIFVIGSEGLKKEFNNFGIKLTTSELAKKLVVGMDKYFNIDTIKLGLDILNKGATYIACNKDGNYKGANNELFPGCGVLISALKTASNRDIDMVIGKPNNIMFLQAEKDRGFKNTELLVIGDTDSDSRAAFKNGSDYLLLVNKKTRRNEIENLIEILDY